MQHILREIESHVEVVEAAKGNAETIDHIARLLIDTFQAGRRLYLIGNGGSAADAQHIAAELVGRFKDSQRPALPAIALTTDSSNITAIGNDFGFEGVFQRQVSGLVEDGDVVWALSVSGSSKNIISAVQQAKTQGARIIGFTGLRGEKLKALSDIALVVKHNDSDRVQEVHMLAYHVVCGLVEKAFGGKP